MNNNLKIGDFVFLVDATNCHTAVLNKSYTILDVIYDYSNRKLVSLKELDLDMNGNVILLDARRFSKDIKRQRKNKLKKLFKYEQTKL